MRARTLGLDDQCPIERGMCCRKLASASFSELYIFITATLFAVFFLVLVAIALNQILGPGELDQDIGSVGIGCSKFSKRVAHFH